MLQANGKAPAWAYHSGTLYRHELWVFGGVYPRPDPQPDGCSNDIHVFNPMDESWYEPIVNGTKPTPRSGQVIGSIYRLHCTLSKYKVIYAVLISIMCLLQTTLDY